MNIRQKIATPLLLTLSMAFLSACNLIAYGTLEYNNLIVERITEASDAIQTSIQVYDQSIPDLVTEEVDVDTIKMRSSLQKVISKLKWVESSLDFQSKNAAQYEAIQLDLQVYIDAGNLFADSYEATLRHYEFQTYKEDVEQVEVLDEELFTHYSTFIEANNDLVTTLGEFTE